MRQAAFVWGGIAALAMAAVDAEAGERLLPAKATMAQVLERPRDPTRDPLPSDPHVAEQIRRGYQIFQQTQTYAPKIAGNGLVCGNCHLNAGQKEGALPLVGVAAVFPEYNKRAGRLFSLEDRIVGCFLRSLNASGVAHPEGAGYENAPEEVFPSPRSAEVLAISAYLTWLSEGLPVGQKLPWRGKNTIDKEALIPVEALDRAAGQRLYEERCANCHGLDGQGVEIGEFKAGPLWGPRSWNDGAGAARVYTLAGYIRYAMPYLAPGSLTDEEAQLIAAYIDAKPRPRFLAKHTDYQREPLPRDAVYYPKAKGSAPR